MLHRIRRRWPALFTRVLVFTIVLLLAGLLIGSRADAQAAAGATPTAATPVAAAPAWQRAVDSLITAEQERTRTPGLQVAIALDGKVIYSRGFGVADIETGRPVTPQTLFRVGSVTKMVSAAAVTELAVEGKLDLNAPISRYVTELEGRKVGAVTTHQLLTHTAGWLDNAVPYGRMGEGALGEVMREVNDTLFFTGPGRVLSYSNPGFSMVGYVAERAGGARFGALVDERILRKFGMPFASFRPMEVMTRDFSQGHVGQTGNAGVIVRPFTENTAQWAAGFLMASAQDMSRFTIALMDGGMLDGHRVLSAETVRRMTTGDPVIPGDTSGARYAYGLMVGTQANTRVWQHGGAINGFDANVTMFPDKRLSVVVLDNRGGAPMSGITMLVAREVAGLILPTPAEPSAPRAPTAAERAALVGTYVQGRTRVELALQGDTLIFQQNMLRVAVQMVGADRISIAPPVGPKITMILVRDAQGRVAYLHQGLRAIAKQRE